MKAIQEAQMDLFGSLPDYLSDPSGRCYGVRQLKFISRDSECAILVRPVPVWE